MKPEERLKEIALVIETVDNRSMAVDGPVTPTLEEMTKSEICRIYETEYSFFADRVEKYQRAISAAIMECILRRSTQYVDIDSMRFKIVPWLAEEENGDGEIS